MLASGKAEGVNVDGNSATKTVTPLATITNSVMPATQCKTSTSKRRHTCKKDNKDKGANNENPHPISTKKRGRPRKGNKEKGKSRVVLGDEDIEKLTFGLKTLSLA